MMLANLALAPASRAGTSYDAIVLADSPSYFWELEETSGTTAADSADTNPGTYNGTVTLNQAGIGDGKPSVLFDGASAYVSTATEIAAPGPLPPFTLEAWFKTTNNGSVISFSITQPPGGSGSDRMIYVGTDGNVYFGIYTGSLVYVNTTTGAYSDGNWHYVAGVIASNGHMTLYVDGVSVASNTNTAAPGSYTGYWVTAASGGGGWPSRVTAPAYFNGNLAKTAVYPTALTAAQVSAHYNARSLSGVSAASGTIVLAQATARASSW